MDQAGIIRDLLVWLEGHLDQPLSLDNVAAKAGYSKWHLQRMFKDVTGHAIGAYIRARRLSKSAVALRLTARPILDIALQYRFDSQQTFTRAFKKQFSLTPALYRRSPDWSSFGMRPPLRLGEFTMPKYEFVTQPTTHLVGVTQSYTCKLEEISEFRQQMRVQFWRDFLRSGRIDHDQARVSSDAPSFTDLNHGENCGDLQPQALTFRHFAERCLGATLRQDQIRISTQLGLRQAVHAKALGEVKKTGGDLA